MYVIDINTEDAMTRALFYLRDILEAAAEEGIRSIRVGIDPIDSGLKFSVDYGTWSPPIAGKIGT